MEENFLKISLIHVTVIEEDKSKISKGNNFVEGIYSYICLCMPLKAKRPNNRLKTTKFRLVSYIKTIGLLYSL